LEQKTVVGARRSESFGGVLGKTKKKEDKKKKKNKKKTKTTTPTPKPQTHPQTSPPHPPNKHNGFGQRVGVGKPTHEKNKGELQRGGF